MFWRKFLLSWLFGIVLLSGLLVPVQGQTTETDIQARNYFRYLGAISRVEGLAWGLEAIDFDQNGRTDLVLGLDNGTVVIYQYKGVGAFKPISTVDNLGRQVRGVAAGDLTGDGFEDLVVGNTEGQIQLLVNQQGNGSFLLHTDVLADAGSKTYGLVMADFRGNGVLDIIAGNSEGQILYYKNAGNLTFEETRLRKPIDVGHNAWGLAVADFDLDGRPDIVVGDTDGEVEIFFNHGNESGMLDFSTEVYAPLGVRNPVRIGVKAPRDRTIGVNAYGVAIGDFDNDSFPDVVVGDGVGNVALFYMDENGKLQWAGYLTSSTSPYGLAVADFDQDGDEDIVIGAGAEIGQYSTLKLYLNIPIEAEYGAVENIIGLTSNETDNLLMFLGIICGLILGSGMVVTLFWYSSKLKTTPSRLLRDISLTTWFAVAYSFQNISRNKRRTLTLAIGFLVGGALVSGAFIYLDTAPRLGIRSALQETSYEIIVKPDFPWNDPEILENITQWALTQDLVEQAEIVYRTISLFGSNNLSDSHYLGIQGLEALNPPGILISDEWGAFGGSSGFFDSISDQFEVEGAWLVNPQNVVISRSFAAEIGKKLNLTIRAGDTLDFSLAQQRPNIHLYDPAYLADYSRMILSNVRVSGIFQRKAIDKISSSTFGEETLGEAIFFDASFLPNSVRKALFLDHLLPSLFIRVDRGYMERIGLLNAADEIERFAIDIEALFRFVDVTVQTEQVREVQGHYQSTSIVILFLIIPSVVLAAALTLFSTNLVIKGRGREIAALKSRGAGYGELIVMMGSELFIVGAAMAIISVFFGLILAGLIPSSSDYLNVDISGVVEFSQQANVPLFAWLGSFIVCGVTCFVFTIGPIRKFIYSDIDIAMKQEERHKDSFITQYNIDFILIVILTLMFTTALIVDISIPWLDEDQNRSLFFTGMLCLWVGLTYSISRTVSNFLPRLARSLRSILGYRIVFVSGNIGRRKAQVISLILILAFVFSVGAFAAISKDIIASNTREQIEFKVGADIKLQTNGVTSNFTQELEKEPGVRRATSIIQAPAVMGGKSILMLGVDPDPFKNLLRWRDDGITRPSSVDDLFTNFQSRSRVIVNSEIATDLDLKIGELAQIQAVGGNWDNFMSLEVAGMANLVPGFGDFSKSFHMQYPNILDKDGGFVIVHKELLTEPLSEGMDPIIGDKAEILFISTEEGVNTRLLKKQLLLHPEVLQVIASDDVKEEEQRSISLFGLSGALLLSFFSAVFLGFCSLIIFLNYLVEARKQEYAIMRVGGAKKGQIVMLIFAEFLLILGASFVIGIILGTFFSIVFVILAGPLLPNLSLLPIDPIPIALNNPFVLFSQEIFFVLGGSLLISLCLMILGLIMPARRAGATNVSETLRNL
ncbi:MAG: FG-GAP-like repeat-containing protein [Candidatus Thorarchaeota archaeon]